MPAFWILLAVIILAPCACFLLLAVSPRLFGQGSQWFTLAYLRQSLTGATAVAITNSLWVSSSAAVIGILLGFVVLVFLVSVFKIIHGLFRIRRIKRIKRELDRHG